MLIRQKRIQQVTNQTSLETYQINNTICKTTCMPEIGHIKNAKKEKKISETTKWSPVLFTLKYRFCCNYRSLNSAIYSK